MNLLVTAGNTHAPIDRVRVITNVFSGRTGAAIARAAVGRGHRATLLTSHPETIPEPLGGLAVVSYQTFDELAFRLKQEVTSGAYDAVLHAAAVSDYLTAGAYVPESGTAFNPQTRQWAGESGPPRLVEHRAGKIKSHGPELWLRLVRAPKLIDLVRSPWGFRGVLVKFKLEVAVTDAELLATAEASRVQSGADLIVANTLDGMAEFAYVGPVGGRYERVPRSDLAGRLVEAVERLKGARDG